MPGLTVHVFICTENKNKRTERKCKGHGAYMKASAAVSNIQDNRKEAIFGDSQMNTFATVIQELIPVVSKQEVLNNSMLLFPTLPYIVAKHAKGGRRV